MTHLYEISRDGRNVTVVFNNLETITLMTEILRKWNGHIHPPLIVPGVDVTRVMLDVQSKLPLVYFESDRSVMALRQPRYDLATVLVTHPVTGRVYEALVDLVEPVTNAIMPGRIALEDDAPPLILDLVLAIVDLYHRAMKPRNFGILYGVGDRGPSYFPFVVTLVE